MIEDTTNIEFNQLSKSIKCIVFYEDGTKEVADVNPSWKEGDLLSIDIGDTHYHCAEELKQAGIVKFRIKYIFEDQSVDELFDDSQ